VRIEGFSVEGLGVEVLELSCWFSLVRVWGLGLAVDGIEDTGIFAEPKQSSEAFILDSVAFHDPTIVFFNPLGMGSESGCGFMVHKLRINQETRKGDMMELFLVEGKVHRPSNIPVVTVCARRVLSLLALIPSLPSLPSPGPEPP